MACVRACHLNHHSNKPQLSSSSSPRRHLHSQLTKRQTPVDRRRLRPVRPPDALDALRGQRGGLPRGARPPQAHPNTQDRSGACLSLAWCWWCKPPKTPKTGGKAMRFAVRFAVCVRACKPPQHLSWVVLGWVTHRVADCPANRPLRPSHRRMGQRTPRRGGGKRCTRRCR